MPLQLIIAAWLAAGARASATLCAAFPGACDGSFAGEAIVVDGNATIGGTIPTELGQLPGLQEVRLLRCRLSGTVPSEVGRLTALRTLIVGDAPFSGTVPSEVGRLTALRTLALAQSALSGTVPVEVAVLIELQVLGFFATSLSGTTPTQLGMLGALQELDFDTTSLSGTTPTQLGMLGALQHVDLDTTSLSGTAQFEAMLGDLTAAMDSTFTISFSASSYDASLRGVIAAHFTLVAALVAVILGLAVDFGLKMRRYQRGVADGDWRGVAPRRLAKQVAFLTGRFASHAPSWQLVIWARQFALFVVALVATLLRAAAAAASGGGDGDVSAYNRRARY